MLYTTVDGGRRIITGACNLALNVVEMAGNVFQYAEFETTCHMAREPAMTAMPAEQMLSIREGLTENLKCAAILLGIWDIERSVPLIHRATGFFIDSYTEGRPRSTQLVGIPEAFLPLPAYTLALQKYKLLKAHQVSSKF